MINYLLVAPSKATAQTFLSGDGRMRTEMDGTVTTAWEWAQDRIIEVKVWTATVPTEVEGLNGDTVTIDQPVYDPRYFVVLTLPRARPALLEHARCVLAWDSQTNEVLVNKLSAAAYTDLNVSPRILGHAWIGKPDPVVEVPPAPPEPEPDPVPIEPVMPPA